MGDERKVKINVEKKGRKRLDGEKAKARLLEAI